MANDRTFPLRCSRPSHPPPLPLSLSPFRLFAKRAHRGGFHPRDDNGKTRSGKWAKGVFAQTRQ